MFTRWICIYEHGYIGAARRCVQVIEARPVYPSRTSRPVRGGGSGLPERTIHHSREVQFADVFRRHVAYAVNFTSSIVLVSCAC